MTSSESYALLRTRLLLSLKPFSDKARLFRPLLANLLHVVKNDAVVCCWEQSTRLVVILQTAAWWSGKSSRKLLEGDSVAQEQYFCTSWPVFSKNGLAPNRLFGETGSILEKIYEYPRFDLLIKHMKIFIYMYITIMCKLQIRYTCNLICLIEKKLLDHTKTLDSIQPGFIQRKYGIRLYSLCLLPNAF